MAEILGTMFTMTTYGTWLRGDSRGWVDRGIVKPPDPALEAADRERMNHDPFRFAEEQLFEIGEAMGKSLIERKGQKVLALTVQTWHVHFVVGASTVRFGQIVKCAKDAVRWELRVGRPIWTDGCDKRFCFSEEALQQRIRYVEQHNIRMGWPPQPWSWMNTH